MMRLPLLDSRSTPLLITLAVVVVRTVKTDNAVGSLFRVVWNYPDKPCQLRNIDFGLSKYGLVANSPRTFVGDQVATLYSHNVGMWPSFTNNDITKPINGGIPQLANLTSHLEKMRKDIVHQIREEAKGFGVLDQEIWRSLYDMNFGAFKVYKTASIMEARRKHQAKSEAQYKVTAQTEWDQSARELMERSLLEARAVRPNVHWGYYLHPQTWWSPLHTQEINDRMAWLFRASTGIYPSIYIKDAAYASPTLMEQRIKATLTEAFRVRAAHGRPSSTIVAYTIVQSDNDFYNKSILDFAIGLPAEMGIDGVIIWGSSRLFKPNPTAKCAAIKNYVENTLGPYVSQLMDRLTSCSIVKCGGRGRCVRNDYSQGVPQNLVKEPLANKHVETSHTAADQEREVSYGKRKSFQENIGKFTRGNPFVLAWFSNCSRGPPWLSSVRHYNWKDVFVKSIQIPNSDASYLHQNHSGRTTQAPHTTFFHLNQRIAAEDINALIPPVNERTVDVTMITKWKTSAKEKCVSSPTIRVSDRSTRVPDRSTRVPDRSTIVSDRSTRVPDRSTTVPDSSTRVSDRSTIVPDRSTSVPDSSTRVPDRSTIVPDRSTRVPDRSTIVPDRSINGTESTTSRSGRSASKSTRSTYELQAKASLRDHITDNLFNSPSSAIFNNLTLTINEHKDLNSHSFPDSPIAENTRRDVLCPDNPLCASKETPRDTTDTAPLIRSSRIIGNVYTTWFSIFNKLAALYHHFLSPVRQFNYTPADQIQQSSATRTLASVVQQDLRGGGDITDSVGPPPANTVSARDITASVGPPPANTASPRDITASVGPPPANTASPRDITASVSPPPANTVSPGDITASVGHPPANTASPRDITASVGPPPANTASPRDITASVGPPPANTASPRDITASVSPPPANTASPRHKGFPDIGTANSDLVVEDTDQGGENRLQEQHVVDSHPQPQAEEYADYVCQCYGNFQGPTCDDRNKV